MPRAFPAVVAAAIALAAAQAKADGWTWDPASQTLSHTNGWAFATTGTADALVVSSRTATPDTVQDADFRTVKADTGCTVVGFGSVFQNCNKVGTCGIPASTRKLGRQMFAWGAVTNLVVEPGYAFAEIPQKFVYGSVGAWSFTLEEGVTNVAAESLGGYPGDAGGVLRIPASCEAIGSSAFANGKFRRLEFADGCKVKAIPNSAFNACAATNVVVLPPGVRSIGSVAFAYSKIGGIVFPEALESVGNRAFYSTSLKGVAFPEGLKTLDKEAFASAGITGSVRFPASLETVGDLAFSGNTGVKEWLFEEGCREIGRGAFQKSSGCTNVVFPKSLRSVGGGALFGGDYWGSMKTGVVTWNSCPAFSDGGTNLFFRCNYWNNGSTGTGKDMTITNVLRATKWERFAADYEREHGFAFTIPENKARVGTWWSGRAEAVMIDWDFPTLVIVR